MIGAVCVVFAPSVAFASGLDGTWSVVARPGTLNTCGGKAEEDTYQWVITERPGAVSVVVSGETAYPKLAGTLKDGTLLLEGEGQGKLYATAYPNTVYVLKVKERTVAGTRYVMHFKSARQGGVTTCLVTYSVRGKRM
jgi:hypothetical protein